MKTVFLVLAVIIGSVLLWNYVKNDSTPAKKTKQISSFSPPTISILPQTVKKEYLFVPYWSFTKTIVKDDFDTLIYFGIGVNTDGIDTHDKGYENLQTFGKLTGNAGEKILAVRMVDKTINSEVLKNIAVQENIATQAVQLAQANGFDGVLLDYETSAFGFDSTTNNISSFYRLFSQKVYSAGLKFFVTLYGDTYFRARPFDVKTIGKLSDKVIVMAYDFSKSGGNPGPDFPLSGREQYGYDFKEMVDDYQKDVANEKLVITLGYFGYDWRVDSRGNALADGVPLSTNEITQEFITKCGYKTCVLSRVQNTNEPYIKYIDDGGEQHTVWFEDEVSLAKKREYLKSKGILETAAWAYSYF